MSRVEENAKMVDYISKDAHETNFKNFESEVSSELSYIVVLLMDISKSLAIMADNSSKPTYKTYEQLAHEAAEKI